VKIALIVILVLLVLGLMVGGKFVSTRNDLVTQREAVPVNGPTWMWRCSAAPT
jgi:hypothetical protein